MARIVFLSFEEIAVLKYITAETSPFQKNIPAGISVAPAPTRNGPVVFNTICMFAVATVPLTVVVIVEPLYCPEML